jgi:hypothetical protein
VSVIGDPTTAVPVALLAHPAVREVRLVGSRATGTAGPLSDHDFVVRTDRLDEVLRELPEIVIPLAPLSQQWDRLGPPEYSCYMLMLRGPAKIDLIFPDLPHRPEPPWEVSATTLPGIDAHFWDWILWMTSKLAAGLEDLVRDQLTLLHEHLLGPLGVREPPATIPAAVGTYLSARTDAEHRLRMQVPRTLEREIVPVLPDG